MYSIGTKIQKDYEAIVKQYLDSYAPSYLDFMQEYGSGCISYFLDIIDIEEIAEMTMSWQDFINDNFWDNSDVLETGERKNCYITAISIDGDLILYNKTDRCFYILPRQHYEIIKLGNDFFEVIKWLFSSDVIVQSVSELYFRHKNKIQMKRFAHSTPPEINTFVDNMKNILHISHLIYSPDFVDIFLNEFGAHINYSNKFDQLIIEYEKSDDFIYKTESQLLKMGFRLTEQY